MSGVGHPMALAAAELTNDGMGPKDDARIEVDDTRRF